MQFQLSSTNAVIRNICLSNDCFLLERAAITLLSQDPQNDTMFQSIIRHKATITVPSSKPSSLSIFQMIKTSESSFNPLQYPSFFVMVMDLIHKANSFLLRTHRSSHPVLPVTYNFRSQFKRPHDDPRLLLQADEEEFKGFFILGVLYQFYQRVMDKCLKVSDLRHN